MSDRILVSTRKGLFELERRPAGWAIARHDFPGNNVSVSLSDPRDGRRYAALSLGHFGCKLQVSEDAGAHWRELSVPAYGPDDRVVTGDGKPPLPATLQLVWSLVAGAASQPGRLWAGTLPGGLFRSDDGGESWKLMRGLWDRSERNEWFGGGYDAPGIHSICLDPREPRCLRVAISCGGVWRSDDDGASWILQAQGLRAAFMPPERAYDGNIQDPHRMVQCAAAPDRLWIQHHNGVFRSDDGAASWVEIETASPSSFGFAVAVHPQDPDTCWLVPAVKDERRYPVDARFCVARTRDGGQSFEVLRKGLPEGPAYDLVYRHALAVDDSGCRLAMGSTTGGLWTSEDGGDSWTALDARLPPVHAVEFIR
ncbi:WD40/YVTN/BNR-like repeat-containing protein [Pseudomarimonas salicorniae]|uniref:Exo-alpha-sialidase n=1 Tax=Pseudomarimonas salicorniae TaxID=2933270 RepID=A0ABT0GIP5_9GAMM|nr:exo-alpha-sialidase [Lysobacter sp. CAU 1642]MCK7594408.1 exo-alpha-sialidase [Lysobacter sp. CAU 1642]